MNETVAQLPSPQAETGQKPVGFEILPAEAKGLSLKHALLWAAGAIVCFHIAYAFHALAFVIVGYLFGLIQLTRVSTARHAVWLGFGVGFLTAAPQLTCFWTLFGTGALALWSILGFWIGLFVVLGRLCLRRFGLQRGALFLPFLWIGLEYFRGELYHLKFSWLNAGYCFSGTIFQNMFHVTGIYGAGFLSMAIAVALLVRSKNVVVIALCVMLAGLVGFFIFGKADRKRQGPKIAVAGVQLEFPAEFEVITALDRLIAHHPEAELLLLSEYTFMDGPVPEKVREWCRAHKKYLVVGGKDPAPQSNFFDTAFVVAPTGDIVFKQVKCVPVQFMKDGLPAREQQIWESPWGRIGICICYDLSYTRVTDRLVELGARALVVPTMDVIAWGRHEHELHARVAPVRATEYGIPVFRVGSSGISQLVDGSGNTIASAGFPGDHAELAGDLWLGGGIVPLDRWLALAGVGITGCLILWFILGKRLIPD